MNLNSVRVKRLNLINPRRDASGSTDYVFSVKDIKTYYAARKRLYQNVLEKPFLQTTEDRNSMEFQTSGKLTLIENHPLLFIHQAIKGNNSTIRLIVQVSRIKRH